MAERSWVIGNSADCDIRVEGRTVSAQHCRISERGESFLLEDLQSTNGTYVAGEKITGPRIVRRGDPVTLGQKVLLPWPPTVVSITVGRLPDNDLMIPLETVSAHHARLDRIGDRVFLIDEGSTNGTAINDPLNKIKRAELQPTDAVFLGTHRVAAADLLAALPPTVVQDETFLERDRPPQLAHVEPANTAEPKKPTGAAAAAPEEQADAPAGSMNSPTAWLWGIIFSLLVLVAIFGGARLLRQPATTASSAATPSQAGDHDLPVAVPNDPCPQDPVRGPDPKAPPDEALVRKSAEGVTMIGLRSERSLALTDLTAWACDRNRVICPTSILEEIEKMRQEPGSPNESIVVCTPTMMVAVLDHKAGVGLAAGFSIATLETPLDAVCRVSAGTNATTCVPGQKLAMLSTWSAEHDSKAIVRKFTYLTVDRIDRSSDHSPTMYKCRSDGELAEIAGSPVFDSSGRVVGCAQFASTATREVHVVPIARLVSVLETKH